MAFQPHSSFDALASVIEQLGAGGRTVQRAEAAAGDEDDALCATVDVAVPLSTLGSSGDGDVSLEPLDGAGEEGISFGFRVPGLDAIAAAGEDTEVAVRPVGATLETESMVATLEIVIQSADAVSGIDDASESRAPNRDRDGSDPFRRGGSRRERNDATDAGDDGLSEGVGPSVAADGDAADDAESDDGEPTGEGDGELAAARDESVPPYEDAAYLERLYEACDTFAEMSERIEMDVSAETVRRYMIDADVHTPTSYELGERGSRADRGHRDATRETTGDDRPTPPSGDGAESEGATDEAANGSGDADEDDRPDDAGRGAETRATGTRGTQARETETTDGGVDAHGRVDSESLPDEQLVADGIGLPESLTLPEVVEAIVDARTVYDVQRALGLGHDRTRQLLRQLNVLDLVLCRASQAAAREVSVETVAGRIRQCTPDGA